MKKSFRPALFHSTLFLFASAVAQAAPSAPAQPVQDMVLSGFGVGAVIGDPVGVSLSLPLGDNSIDVVAGYEFVGGKNLTLLGAYLWHDRELIGVESGKLSVYYGPGFRLRIEPESIVGLRGVVGFDYVLEQDPLQIYFELGPGINIVPDTRIHFTVGLGARYFF